MNNDTIVVFPRHSTAALKWERVTLDSRTEEHEDCEVDLELTDEQARVVRDRGPVDCCLLLTGNDMFEALSCKLSSDDDVSTLRCVFPTSTKSALLRWQHIAHLKGHDKVPFPVPRNIYAAHLVLASKNASVKRALNAYATLVDDNHQEEADSLEREMHTLAHYCQLAEGPASVAASEQRRVVEALVEGVLGPLPVAEKAADDTSENDSSGIVSELDHSDGEEQEDDDDDDDSITSVSTDNSSSSSSSSEDEEEEEEDSIKERMRNGTSGRGAASGSGNSYPDDVIESVQSMDLVKAAQQELDQQPTLGITGWQVIFHPLYGLVVVPGGARDSRCDEFVRSAVDLLRKPGDLTMPRQKTDDDPRVRDRIRSSHGLRASQPQWMTTEAVISLFAYFFPATNWSELAFNSYGRDRHEMPAPTHASWQPQDDDDDKMMRRIEYIILSPEQWVTRVWVKDPDTPRQTPLRCIPRQTLAETPAHELLQLDGETGRLTHVPL